MMCWRRPSPWSRARRAHREAVGGSASARQGGRPSLSGEGLAPCRRDREGSSWWSACVTRGIVDVRDAGDAPQWWPYEGGDGRRSCTARNNPISGISFGFPFSERKLPYSERQLHPHHPRTDHDGAHAQARGGDPPPPAERLPEWSDVTITIYLFYLHLEYIHSLFSSWVPKASCRGHPPPPKVHKRPPSFVPICSALFTYSVASAGNFHTVFFVS